MLILDVTYFDPEDPGAVTADDGPEDESESFDFDSPGTHEDVQASQPELGQDKPRKAKTKKSKAPKGKKAKAKAPKAPKARASKKGKAKAPKTPKAPRAKKPKAKREPVKFTGQKRGVPKDGSARKAPGTNPPRSEEAGKIGEKIAKARNKLKEAAKAKGKAGMWTQGYLAKKVGISQPGLANIERGQGVSEELAAKLLKALGA